MAEMRRTADRAEHVLSRVLAMGMLLLVVVAASAFATGYSAQMGRANHTSVATTASRPGDGTQGDPVVFSGSMPGVGMGIWVDERGRPVPPPPGGGQALVRAAQDAGTVLVAGGALLAGLWYVGRRLIARRNLRRWELEWQRVGPEWSRGKR